MICLFFNNLFMSLGIKSLTLVPQDFGPTRGQLLEGSVCTLRITNPHPERNKQAFQHTLFRKRVPDSVFHKRKQWQFIRTVLQIKQNQIHIETYLKTNFKTYCLVSSFPWTRWELLFLVFHLSVIQDRPRWKHLGKYRWDPGTNVLFSKLAEVLRVRSAKGMQGNETYVSITVPTLLCFESNVRLSPNQEYRPFCNTQGKSGTT